MERSGEEAKTEESARGGVGPIGWLGAQRGQEARQQTKRPQGRPGQKPQEENRSPAQRATPSAGASEEVIENIIASIRARFGDGAIGLGDHGIRFVGDQSLGAPRQVFDYGR